MFSVSWFVFFLLFAGPCQLEKQLWVKIPLRDRTDVLELVGNALKHYATQIMLQHPIDYPNFAENDLHLFGHHLARLPLQLVKKLPLFVSYNAFDVCIATRIFFTHLCHH